MDVILVDNISLSTEGEFVALQELEEKNSEGKEILYDVRVQRKNFLQFYPGLTKQNILTRIKEDFRCPVLYIARSNVEVPLNKYFKYRWG